MEPYEAYDVDVTLRAVEAFRYHHGGPADAARKQLSAMLEDFLTTSTQRTNSDGTISLSRKGFQVTITPDLGTLTGYSCAHKERTWEQVKSGVPSRIKAAKRARIRAARRAGRGDPPIPDGPPLSLTTLQACVDAGSIVLTDRARTNYARLREHNPVLAEAGTDDAGLRALLGYALRDGQLTQHPSGVFELAYLGRRWVLTESGLALLGIGQPREPTATPHTPGD